MSTQTTYPRIKAAKPLADWKLRVEFENGVAKVYDCTPLLDKEPFRPLRDEGLFRSVRVDEHGYGIIWNDEIDLAESELWIHGRPVDPPSGSVTR